MDYQNVISSSAILLPSVSFSRFLVLVGLSRAVPRRGSEGGRSGLILGLGAQAFNDLPSVRVFIIGLL